MPKALIVYATRNGETRNIGEIIAEGLRFSMIDVIHERCKGYKNRDRAGRL